MEKKTWKRKAGPGRPKGLRNRKTLAAQEAIEIAADELGGATRLVAWAKEAPENERLFWGTIYPKLLPLRAHMTGAFSVNWPLGKSKLDE